MKILRALSFLWTLPTSSTALAQQIDVPEWFFNNDGKTYIGVSMPGAPREQAVTCALLYMMFDVGSVNVDSTTDSQEVVADGKRTYDLQSYTVWSGIAKCDYDIVREKRLDSGETMVAITPGTSCHTDIRFICEYSLNSVKGKTQKEIAMTMMSSNDIMWSFTSKTAGNGPATVKSRYVTADSKEHVYTGETKTYVDNSKGEGYWHNNSMELDGKAYIGQNFTQIKPCLGAALIECMISISPAGVKSQTDTRIETSLDMKNSKSITKTTERGKLPSTRFINISVEDNMLKASVQTDKTEK